MSADQMRCIPTRMIGVFVRRDRKLLLMTAPANDWVNPKAVIRGITEWAGSSSAAGQHFISAFVSRIQFGSP
jgi:hypothetical protein